MKSKLLILWLCVQLLSFSAWAQDENQEGDEETRYVDLTPAFVTNYGGPGRLKYIKAEVSLRVESLEAYREVMYHNHSLRHAMVMLLSRQNDESVTSTEGKENLRQQALSELQAVMQAEEGQPYIEDLFFSSFYVQQ